MHFGVGSARPRASVMENDAAPRCSCATLPPLRVLLPVRSDRSCVTKHIAFRAFHIITFTAAAFLLLGFGGLRRFTLTFFFFP